MSLVAVRFNICTTFCPVPTPIVTFLDFDLEANSSFRDARQTVLARLMDPQDITLHAMIQHICAFGIRSALKEQCITVSFRLRETSHFCQRDACNTHDNLRPFLAVLGLDQ